MVANSLNDELLNDLGDDFARRLRRGETPSITEYTKRFKGEQAIEVENFLDSIAMLEGMKRGNDSAEETLDELPEEFGRYKIERSLGEGGMGAVYLAHDSQLNRKVALKTPKFAKNSDPNLMSRFYREARSAATLQHPNICPVYDVGEIDGIHYISMAYIDGRPLSDFIQSGKSPPVTSVVRIVRKIALALHEAHSNGVVHRDLKPANIMVDRRNEPIVMDFGLARQFGNENDSETQHPITPGNITLPDEKRFQARLTLDGTVVGSPGYMSPEQLFGEHQKIGPASDIYALGVLLYELLTRELPFPGDGTLMSIVSSVISDDPPDASAIRPQLDARVNAIYQKAMAKRIEDRYETMQALAVALTEALKSNSSVASGPTVSEIANPSSSPELVRTKEQYELAKSLYQEGQYAAAVSILEKMVAGSGQQTNQYTAWAKKELPKAKARANAEAASFGDETTNQRGNDEFWNDDFNEEAANTVSYARGSTQRSKSKSKKKSPQRFPSSVAAFIGIAVLLVTTFIAIEFSGTIASDNADSQTTDDSDADTPAGADLVVVEKVEQNDSPEDNPREVTPRARPFATGRLSPAERLWRLDTDRDGTLSKAEMTRSRIPLSGPARQVARNFDEYDLVPRDGVLDETEVRQMLRTLAKPGNRENAGRRRPVP